MRATNMVLISLTFLTATPAAPQDRAAVARGLRSQAFVGRAMTHPASARPIGRPATSQPRSPLIDPFWGGVYVPPTPAPTQLRFVPVIVVVPASGGALRCAVVELRVGDRAWRNRVALPSHGAATAGALQRVLSKARQENRQLAVRALNGTRFVIPAGGAPAVVRPCEHPGGG